MPNLQPQLCFTSASRPWMGGSKVRHNIIPIQNLSFVLSLAIVFFQTTVDGEEHSWGGGLPCQVLFTLFFVKLSFCCFVVVLTDVPWLGFLNPSLNSMFSLWLLLFDIFSTFFHRNENAVREAGMVCVRKCQVWACNERYHPGAHRRRYKWWQWQ